MKRVRLINIQDQVEQALNKSSEFFEVQYQVRLGETAELARDVVRQTTAMLVNTPREAPWGGYLAVDEDTTVVVGCCGFKNGPTPDGTLEVAYFSFPMFERQGYGTAMAAKLLAIAIPSPSVRRVIAHTLPEKNASTRILEKIGMRLVGEVEDPEDGRVWQWEKVREA